MTVGDKSSLPLYAMIAGYRESHLDFKMGHHRLTALYCMEGNIIWDHQFTLKLFGRELYWEEW